MNESNKKTALYFVAHLSQQPRAITGPYSIDGLTNELISGSFEWTDLAWKEGQAEEWKRLFEIPEVYSAMSVLPAPDQLKKFSTLCADALKGVKNEVISIPKTQEANPIYFQNIPDPQMPIYLQVAGSEFGPMSLQEVKTVLGSGGFKEQIYIWYKGLETWFPIEEILAVKNLGISPEDIALSTRRGVSLQGLLKTREHRTSIRHRIVATCSYLAKDRRVSLGVCADISRGGLQVWVEKESTFELNQTLELQVVPLSVSGLSVWNLKAKVAWFRPNELRMGLIFIDIPSGVADQISNYFKKIESDS